MKIPEQKVSPNKKKESLNDFINNKPKKRKGRKRRSKGKRRG